MLMQRWNQLECRLLMISETFQSVAQEGSIKNVTYLLQQKSKSFSSLPVSFSNLFQEIRLHSSLFFSCCSLNFTLLWYVSSICFILMFFFPKFLCHCHLPCSCLAISFFCFCLIFCFLWACTLNKVTLFMAKINTFSFACSTAKRIHTFL